MKIEREFFYPNLAGYLGTSAQNVEEMQKKVDIFTPLYKVNRVVNDKKWTIINQVFQDKNNFIFFPFYWKAALYIMN